MTEEEFRLLAQEAITIQHQAHLLVLSTLIVLLLRRVGASEIEGLKVEDYISAKTKEAVRTLLPSMADHQPGRAAMLSRLLGSLDFYKAKEPPAA